MVDGETLKRIKSFILTSPNGAKITENIRIENSIYSFNFQIIKKIRYFNYYLNKKIRNEVSA
ncbi:MAG: hypothetical protein PVF58_22795 [Candidatus Methanofastidiosia archaeon]|jgi:hypothetical protein